MSNLVYRNRFTILRRLVQFALLILFLGANYLSWNIIQGNYSSALVLNTFYLTDPYMIIQTLCSGFVLSGPAIIGGLIVWGIYALLFGRAFCSWICPVNIIADSTAFVNSRLRISKKKNKIEISRNTRYWLLLGFLILSPIIGAAAFESISPVGMLHRGVIFGSGFGIGVAVFIFFIDMAFKSYGWCGNLCPLGAFYAMSTRFSLLRIKHDHDKCTKCNKCFVVCPEVQVLEIIGERSGSINYGACTLCGRCIEVCDDKALKFSINDYKK